MTHPTVDQLAFLVGRWVGEGHGDYPTIQPFDYHEVVDIEAMPTPVLSYRQRTRDGATGDPRHAESGWFRLVEGQPELVVCQPTGIVEAHSGTLEGTTLDLCSVMVGSTPSADIHRVRTVRRVITVEGDRLRYELQMAAVGQPLQRHLVATLTRE